MAKITTTEPIRLQGGSVLPEGSILDFKDGIAKRKGGDVLRSNLPMRIIKGAKGPFLSARQARLLNDNFQFQQFVKRQYPAYCHCILFGDMLYVFIWDTREIVDVIDMSKYAKPQPIVRKLKNKATGETKEQVMGQTKPWLDKLYKMMEWDSYEAFDNGLPLVSKNKEWAKLAKDLNSKAI
jgi:hypothetical protein